MCEFAVSFHSFADVHNFVQLSQSQPFPISVGCGRHWVNGKSIFCMFTLDYHVPLSVQADCPPEEEAAFRQAYSAFLTE